MFGQTVHRSMHPVVSTPQRFGDVSRFVFLFFLLRQYSIRALAPEQAGDAVAQQQQAHR